MIAIELIARAGLLIPLFSCPSTTSWGIGDIGDIVPIAAWLRGAGQRVLQLLPLNEMAPGQQSPYSAISAMAIDPIFIHRAGRAGVRRRSAARPRCRRDDRDALASIRRAPRIDYRDVAAAEAGVRCARRSSGFSSVEWRRGTRAARRLRRRSSARRPGGSTTTPVPRASTRARASGRGPSGRRRCSGASRRRIDRARRELADEVLFHQYLQWLADAQWQRARDAARTASQLFGDLPFMVDGDSADVWARQDQFRLDVSVGAPPDAFSATGQDWGMPVYDWDGHRQRGFPLAARARAAQRRSLRRLPRRSPRRLLSHLRPPEGRRRRRSSRRPTSRRSSRSARRCSASFAAAGARDHRRGSRHRARLRARVARAARRPGLPRVPLGAALARRRAAVPRSRGLSAALGRRCPARTTPSRSIVWWDEASDDERRKVSARRFSAHAARSAHAPYRPTVRDVLLEALFASGSDLLLLPVQDVFGWRDRINEPATVAESNWTFRLPWPVDRLDEVPEARERQAAAARSGRTCYGVA